MAVGQTSRVSAAPAPPAAKRPPASRVRRHSTSAIIHADLRAQIASLDRLPGAALSESEIAIAYGVSRTPVREAILKLVDEGLVEVFPQSGTFVSRIPLAALPEAIIIRKALEETTARFAAERATRGSIAGLAALLRRQRECNAAGDRDAFHRADESFHAAIADAAGYPGIWALAQQVKVQVDRYRRLTLPREGRIARAIREHAAIVAAIEAGDAAGAAARMGAHLDGLLRDMADIRRLNADYFTEGTPVAHSTEAEPSAKKRTGRRRDD